MMPFHPPSKDRAHNLQLNPSKTRANLASAFTRLILRLTCRPSTHMDPEAAIIEKNTYVQRLNSNKAPYVLALGDSLSADYGLGRSASFAARLEALLRKTCAGAIVQNAGVSGDKTGDGLRRLPRLLASLERKPISLSWSLARTIFSKECGPAVPLPILTPSFAS